MNWEIFVGYLTIGFTIAVIYIIFKSVALLVDLIGDIILSLKRPKPNRKRTSGNIAEVYKFLEIARAAGEFGFNSDKPISKKELKSRFRFKIKKVHPDLGGKNEDFIRVKKAYDLLLSHSVIF